MKNKNSDERLAKIIEEFIKDSPILSNISFEDLYRSGVLEEAPFQHCSEIDILKLGNEIYIDFKDGTPKIDVYSIIICRLNENDKIEYISSGTKWNTGVMAVHELFKDRTFKTIIISLNENNDIVSYRINPDKLQKYFEEHDIDIDKYLSKSKRFY